MSMKLRLAGMGGAPAQTYVDDVFSTWLYTGTGATQTITNGIDLAGKGGLVWIKSRSAATNNFLFDTARGVNVEINSNTTDANATLANSVTAFNSSGFAVGSAAGINVNAATYASWTFRKAAKFFDVVTYSGNSSSNHVITHSLGVAPGMIVIKCTSSAGNDWPVYHRSASGYLLFDDPAAQGAGSGIINVTSSSFSVDSSYGGMNDIGQSYVAYLFAHDTSSTGIIQCGSFNLASAGVYSVNLGWEAQYVLIKRTDSAENWFVADVMRTGFNQAALGTYISTGTLSPNTSAAEGGSTYQSPTSTGFGGYSPTSGNYIYMAIRRPNKPPTTGTQVFSPVKQTGGSNIPFNFPVDLVMDRRIAGNPAQFIDRLRGKFFLQSSVIDAEFSDSSIQFDQQNNFSVNINGVGSTDVFWGFKRAPGFFDEVCYTGTGIARTIAHNLGIAPELMIVKSRSDVYPWWVYVTSIGNTKYSVLNTTAIPATSSSAWNNTTPTSTVFSVGTDTTVNGSGSTYVAYLFATLAGISKVGSYTGNGSSQNIDCGFAAGARFVLIKRTDNTGDWFVWDTARGIVAANDPHLSLNTTAAEVTTDDSVDPYAAGFAVNQVAATNINVSGGTYIFLAIA